jgi:hypothetical protein
LLSELLSRLLLWAISKENSSSSDSRPRVTWPVVSVLTMCCQGERLLCGWISCVCLDQLQAGSRPGRRCVQGSVGYL